jgi:hypothetical protein
MLAAALTVWILFAFWLVAPYLRAERLVRRAAMALLSAELAVLLLWSYGTENCLEPDCAPLAQAAGIAARVDLPVLTAVFLGAAVLRLARAATRAVPE